MKNSGYHGVSGSTTTKQGPLYTIARELGWSNSFGLLVRQIFCGMRETTGPVGMEPGWLPVWNGRQYGLAADRQYPAK